MTGSKMCIFRMGFIDILSEKSHFDMLLLIEWFVKSKWHLLLHEFFAPPNFQVGLDTHRPCFLCDGVAGDGAHQAFQCPFWRQRLGGFHRDLFDELINQLSGQIIATSHDRFPPNSGLVREIGPNPLISGKSRLVKYYNLARTLVW